MRWVTISHPDIGTAQVPASAVPHHAAAGWSVVEDAPAVETGETGLPAADDALTADPFAPSFEVPDADGNPNDPAAGSAS